ncbi:2,3-dihydro-2,3-dihydroxybenzoate dehydrogenase, partial [Salmonella enterica]|nr:2,3-dihydro-2,3-dihydroxybenzoate dehydrogenase [Salmonella enterica]EBR8180457.1 2,3-dihydro-2,3-dihydroxybenzoate dehydrogenase [Salmonella enterica subsp. enterica serovar Heidelberg]
MTGFDFSDKTVWVTGAGKGIGYATALAFVDA